MYKITAQFDSIDNILNVYGRPSANGEYDAITTCAIFLLCTDGDPVDASKLTTGNVRDLFIRYGNWDIMPTFPDFDTFMIKKALDLLICKGLITNDLLKRTNMYGPTSSDMDN